MLYVCMKGEQKHVVYVFGTCDVYWLYGLFGSSVAQVSRECADRPVVGVGSDGVRGKGDGGRWRRRGADAGGGGQ